MKLDAEIRNTVAVIVANRLQEKELLKVLPLLRKNVVNAEKHLQLNQTLIIAYIVMIVFLKLQMIMELSDVE